MGKDLGQNEFHLLESLPGLTSFLSMLKIKALISVDTPPVLANIFLSSDNDDLIRISIAESNQYSFAVRSINIELIHLGGSMSLSGASRQVSAVKSLRQKFEGDQKSEVTVNKPQIRPKQKIVLMRHETMRDSKLLNHRQGLFVHNYREVASQSVSDARPSSDSSENDAEDKADIE